jgi:hypothetical protein
MRQERIKVTDWARIANRRGELAHTNCLSKATRTLRIGMDTLGVRILTITA